MPEAPATSFPKSVSGHLWTVRRALAHGVRPAAVPPAEPWSAMVEDPVVGPVRLSGRLHAADPPSRRALLLVHGLGGSIESGYLRAAAWEAWQRGHTVLRLNLRGCDRSGEDIYHAGLIADLAAAAASPALAGFDELDVWGFSLGGHVALRWAAESSDPRLKRAVAICSPLDLDRGAAALDARGLSLYRIYILRHLNEIVAAVGARTEPCFVYPPAEVLRRVSAIRTWDQLVVAPRFGFTSAEDYYARASVGPLLGGISRPALVVHSSADPMVPIATVRPARQTASSAIEVREVASGGHVSFPASLDLGLGPNRGIYGQVLDWLESGV